MCNSFTLAQVNIFRGFYLLGAGGTLVLGALLILVNMLSVNIVSAESATIMLAGCGSSVLFYVSISCACV